MKLLFVPAAALVAVTALAEVGHASAPTEAGSKSAYFEVNADVVRLSVKAEVFGDSEKDTTTYLGGSFGAGTYFGESATGRHQCGLELGLVGDSDNDSGTKQTDRILTGLFVYNYNFNLGKFGAAYLGASAGLAHYNNDIDDSGLGKATYTDATFAAGLQAGVKIRMSDTVSLNAGYRMMKIGDMKDDIYGVDVKLKDIVAHDFRVGVTFSF